MSNKLSELIHNLSNQEKKYLKKKYNSAKKRLTLFNTIDKNEIYDERSIKKELEKKDIKMNFTGLKKDLYDSILKYLRTYHSEHNKKVHIYELLAEVELLQEKNLREQASERIGKAKKIAEEYHYDILMLKLLLIEKTNLRHQIKKENLTALDKNHQDIEIYLEKVTNSFRLTKLYDDMFFLMRSKKLDENIEEKAKELIDSSLDKLSPVTSFESKMAYHSIWIMYYKHFDEETKHFIVHAKIMLDFFEETPNLIREFSQRYIHFVSSYLNGLAIMKDYSKFPENIAKLENLSSKIKEKENIQIKLFENISYLTMIWHLGVQNYPKALTILPDIEEGLEKYGNKVSAPHRIGFRQTISLTYLHNQQYEKALDSLNKVLNNSKDQSLPDVQLFCRIIRLIIYFELNEKRGDYYKRCESEARSILRAVGASKQNMNFIGLVAKGIQRALGKMPDKQKSIFEKLYTEVSLLKGYINGKNQVLIWLQRKI